MFLSSVTAQCLQEYCESGNKKNHVKRLTQYQAKNLHLHVLLH